MKCPLCAEHSLGLCHACWLKLNRKIPLPKRDESLSFSEFCLALFSRLRTGWTVLRSRFEAVREAVR